jgi:hypothetical protein
MKPLSFLLMIALILPTVLTCRAQESPQRGGDVFTVEMLLPKGEKVEKQKVRLRFAPENLLVETKDGALLKQLAYAEAKAATYSYASQPRLKESVAVTAAGVALGSSLAVLSVTPLLPLVAIIGGLRLARLKGRSHWLTVQASTDYVVLRLNNENRRLITAALETHTQVKVELAPEENLIR